MGLFSNDTKGKKTKQKGKSQKVKTRANVAQLIPIKNRYDDHFICKNDKTHIDIFKIRTHDLDAMSDSERESMIFSWINFYQTYGDDFKIISMNFPTDTSAQQKYYEHKIEENQVDLFDHFLNVELETLQQIAEKQLDRYYYIMTFSEGYEKYKENYFIIKAKLMNSRLIYEDTSFEEKISVLARLGDKNNEHLKTTEYMSLKVDRTKQERETKKRGYNPYLMYDIRPNGGVSFDVQNYYRTGAGYESCLTVHRFPPRLGLYWLIPLMGIDRTVAIVDVHTQNPEETKKLLNSSILENEKRFMNEQELTARDTADDRIQELREYYQQVDRFGQVNKLITIRIFLFERTFQKIDAASGEIKEKIQSSAYKIDNFVNETKADYMSQFMSYSEQQKTIYSRKGQSCLSKTLSKGLPFYFSNIDDRTGAVLGTTGMGSALFDIFTKDDKRLSYNMACFGMMGSGKSTLLKKLILENAIRGNYIRVFDPTGEYSELVHRLGGHELSLDGSSGRINALQILETGESPAKCWVDHVSKLTTCISLFSPGIQEDVLHEFQTTIEEFYTDYGLIDDTIDLNEQTFTSLSPEKYPSWSDYKYFLDKKIASLLDGTSEALQEVNKNKASRLDKLNLIITNLINNFGYLVDGPTTVDGNVFDHQVISFNITGLTNVKPELFEFQIFIALQMCWDNCVRLGSVMKKRWEERDIEWDDIVRFAIIMDESHRLINANRPKTIEQVTIIMREARKYFGGFWLASQSIRDFVPESTQQKNIDQIKTMFELCEYKFIMKQDANAGAMIQKVFPNVLSEGEIDQLPIMSRGETILCMGASKKVNIDIFASEEELEMFRGGA